MTENEMAEWHHRLNGHEFEQTPGDNEGQGSLVCCSPVGSQRVVHNLATEQLISYNHILANFIYKDPTHIRSHSEVQSECEFWWVEEETLIQSTIVAMSCCIPTCM